MKNYAKLISVCPYIFRCQSFWCTHRCSSPALLSPLSSRGGSPWWPFRRCFSWSYREWSTVNTFSICRGSLTRSTARRTPSSSRLWARSERFIRSPPRRELWRHMQPYWTRRQSWESNKASPKAWLLGVRGCRLQYGHFLRGMEAVWWCIKARAVEESMQLASPSYLVDCMYNFFFFHFFEASY